MVRFRLRALRTAGLAAWFAAVPGCAACPEPSGLPSVSHGPLAEAVVAAVGRDPQGVHGAVALAVGGEIVLRQAFGDAMTCTRDDPGLAFDAGSLAKPVTALAAANLAAEGAIDLDAPLSACLPTLHGPAAAASVRDVLTHTSGLPAHHSRSDEQRMDRTDALRAIGDQALSFLPGTGESYSNGGYTLAALCLTEASGRSYEALASDRVFGPAGMDRTGWFGDDRWAGAEAVGHTGRRARKRSANRRFTWALKGNGGLVSTADDLIRLDAHARSLDPSAQALFDTAPVDLFTFGFERRELEDGTAVRSKGGVSPYGFASMLRSYDDGTIQLAILLDAVPRDEPTAHYRLVADAEAALLEAGAFAP